MSKKQDRRMVAAERDESPFQWLNELYGRNRWERGQELCWYWRWLTEVEVGRVWRRMGVELEGEVVLWFQVKSTDDSVLRLSLIDRVSSLLLVFLQRGEKSLLMLLLVLHLEMATLPRHGLL